MTYFRKASGWLRNPLNLVSFAALAAWITFAYEYLIRTTSRLWFFNGDEYVIVAEIIRFSQFDFRQHFFDNPGTFFMFLNAPLWAAFYAVQHAIGAATGGIGSFTFDHLPALFTLSRTATIVFMLLSVVLTFLVVSRLINSSAGAVASMLLAMSPIYNSYSSFIRTDSLALVCVLAAILLLLLRSPHMIQRGDLPPTIRDRVVLAGVFVGLAAGARLHSVTAALPVLLMLIWTNSGPAKSDYPDWVKRWSKLVLPFVWVGSMALIFVAWQRLPNVPAARRLVISAAAACLAVPAGSFLLYRTRYRRWAVAVVRPEVIKIVLGCAIGCVLGNPTVLPRHNYFLDSVEAYSHYRDLDRMQWSSWTNVTWYVSRYLKVIAPDTVTMILLGVGVLSILAMRDRRALPFLTAALLFFFSKPLTLVASEHHVILWLPFFYTVCAYPAGVSLEWLAQRVRYGNAFAAAILALALAAGFRLITPGPRIAAAAAAQTDVRLRNIADATAWLKSAPSQPTVAISYFCSGPDSFYTWLRFLDVPMPDSVFDGREHINWESGRSALRGKKGYVCSTRVDAPAMKNRLSPGELTDPYTDPGFKLLRSFGSGPDQVDVFLFDLR